MSCVFCWVWYAEIMREMTEECCGCLVIIPVYRQLYVAEIMRESYVNGCVQCCWGREWTGLQIKSSQNRSQSL